MKELIFLTSQPNDIQFLWQIEIQLHNFRKLGLLDKYDYHITVWNNLQRVPFKLFAKEWEELQSKYADKPRVKFFFYTDEKGNLNNCIKTYGYHSLVRPWVLNQHFKAHPELSSKAIFYTDQDVLFTKYPDFLDKFKDDDINYLSETRHYIAASYFDSKVKDVKEGMLDAYKTIDPLQNCLDQVGIKREVAEKNEMNSGGAQYILKNIDADFWEKVFTACITIKLTLRSINRIYFENEDKGFQSWCADMWAVLWLLWARGAETRCPPEMDFAWATDFIEKIYRVYIYHNAGVSETSIKHKDKFHKLFYKSAHKYVNNQGTPFEDDHSYVSEAFCSLFYVKEMMEAKRMVVENNFVS